jgi:glycosyltransferase involved in cell wall biosynthesis
MHLLIDCTLLSVGGGVQAGLSVVHNAIREPGLKVSLFCSPQIAAQLGNEEKSLLHYYEIINYSRYLGKPLLARRMSLMESILSPDVVFSVFGPSYWRSRAINLQGFALGKMLYPEEKVNYSTPLESIFYSAFDYFKKHLIFKNCDYLVVETTTIKLKLSKVLQYPLERIYVVENSYSPSFAERCSFGSQKKRTDLSFFRILVPASFYNHKNLEIIPSVCAMLRSFGRNDIRFICTLDTNSKGWIHLAHKAKRQGVSHMIETAGNVPNRLIADLYLDSHAVMCMSFVESSTAVFPETFLAGRPLLASDRDFARNLCLDGALYFDPLSPESIANQIIKLHDDMTLRMKIIEAGKVALKKNYPSPEEKWAKQFHVLNEVLNLPRPKRGKV